MEPDPDNDALLRTVLMGAVAINLLVTWLCWQRQRTDSRMLRALATEEAMHEAAVVEFDAAVDACVDQALARAEALVLQALEGAREEADEAREVARQRIEDTLHDIEWRAADERAQLRAAVRTADGALDEARRRLEDALRDLEGRTADDHAQLRDAVRAAVFGEQELIRCVDELFERLGANEADIHGLRTQRLLAHEILDLDEMEDVLRRQNLDDVEDLWRLAGEMEDVVGEVEDDQ